DKLVTGVQTCALPIWAPRARRRRQRLRPLGRRSERVMRPLLLQGGRVIDPSRDFDQTADVLIEDGKIAAVGAGHGAPDGTDVREIGRASCRERGEGAE